MLETIQQSAISHDRYQVELKLDYELDRGKKTHYRISTYIFVPRSLDITEESYPKAELYRDIKNYIRIKTPEMTLRDLVDSDVSPLRVVQQIIRQPGRDIFQQPCLVYQANGFNRQLTRFAGQERIDIAQGRVGHDLRAHIQKNDESRKKESHHPKRALANRCEDFMFDYQNNITHAIAFP